MALNARFYCAHNPGGLTGKKNPSKYARSRNTLSFYQGVQSEQGVLNCFQLPWPSREQNHYPPLLLIMFPTMCTLKLKESFKLLTTHALSSSKIGEAFAKLFADRQRESAKKVPSLMLRPLGPFQSLKSFKLSYFFLNGASFTLPPPPRTS